MLVLCCIARVLDVPLFTNPGYTTDSGSCFTPVFLVVVDVNDIVSCVVHFVSFWI